MIPLTSVLLADFYQLNMLQSYYEHGMTETAVFEMFVRRLPRDRGFLMAAGLEQAVDFLENVHFSGEELAWLKKSGRFSAACLDRLAAFRFTGDIHAMPEGTVFFPDEPILRVTAPLPEAQLVETRLMNIVHFQTLIASKAARMVLAGAGKTLIDFGCRRAHGAEAALLAARASYIAGFDGTATTLAAPLFGIPIYGTLAHSFIEAQDDERAAFERFAQSRPEDLVLLLDTYDTEVAAEKVVAMKPWLEEKGIALRGVRLDSGDLAEHARRVRPILDAGGLEEVKIFASGGIDEHTLLEFTGQDAPIDGCGIGTSLTTAMDAPAFDCAYKLQEYDGKPRRKRSEGKATWPGCKMVYRRAGDDGVMTGDILTVEGDVREGETLITPVMRQGRRLGELTGLEACREHAAGNLNRLPEALGRLEQDAAYPVEVSAALRGMTAEVDARV
jgi:nicotinate phosphoribosyltransferase